MKQNISERQILMDLMNTEHVLKDGHMVPIGKKRESVVSNEKQEFCEKKGTIFKITNLLKNEALYRRECPKVETSSTKKCLDDIVNIKLDINSMIHVESVETKRIKRSPKEVKKYYMLKSSALELLTIEDFSDYNIKTLLATLPILEDFLTQKEKVQIEEKEDDDLKNLKDKLLLLLEKKMLKHLDYINSRLDSFIELQIKAGTIFDDQYLNDSLSDLTLYYSLFETAYNRYFKIKNSNLQIDYDSITCLLGEVKEKIEVVLRHNNVYTKCIFPPKI